MIDKKTIAVLAIASAVIIICITAVCFHYMDHTDEEETKDGTLVSLDDISYSIWDNGTAKVMMVGNNSQSITIPPVIEYEGDEYVVTCIGELSFGFNDVVKEVSLPDTISTIENRAFALCSLKDIIIPDSVRSIGDQAFWLCNGLESVSIPKGVVHIGLKAFSDCGSLTDLNIDKSNTEYTCENGLLVDVRNKELKAVIASVEGHLDIPDLWKIASEALESSKVTTIRIPSSVVSIEMNALNCGTLEGIDVDSSNQAYSSKDGVLMDKDGCTLLKYPDAKPGKYIVPDSVRTISEMAFVGCSALTGLTIPGTVQTIEQMAFVGCNYIEEISIGSGEMSISGASFFMVTFYASESSIEPLSMDQLPGYTYRGHDNMMYRV